MRSLLLLRCSVFACLRSFFLVGFLLSAALLPAFAAEADLGLSVTAVPTPVIVDQDLRFVIDLVNYGPDSAEDVTIEIDLPAEVSPVAAWPTQGICQLGPPLICQLGQVRADASFNTASVALDTVPNDVSDISLAAAVASSTVDLFLDNNAAIASLSIVEFRDSADLVVGPQIRPSLAFAGVAIEYLIELANAGPSLAEEVSVRVGIQELDMASYLSASSSQGMCSTALDTCVGLECQEVLDQLLEVSCDLGSMAAYNAAWVRVTSNIDLPVGTDLTVSVEVGARDTADSDPSNNLIEVDMQVVEMPGDGVPVPNEPLIDLEGIDAGGTGVACFLQTLRW